MCLGCAVAQSSDDEEEQAQCDQCDNEGPAGEFTECDGCGEIVCDDCRECGEDCFVCRAARTAQINAPAVLGNSTDTPSTETESDESTTESGTTAHYVPLRGRYVGYPAAWRQILGETYDSFVTRYRAVVERIQRRPPAINPTT